ncbi:MAG TPA: cobalamin-dependent protein [Rhodocyclaceae bacterium]|nr:cobalamin-dependent protein [Rhodocyclaceae bacterium]
MDDLTARLREALEMVDRSRAEAIFDEAVRRHSTLEVVEGAVVPALATMGEAWSAGKLALSQIYMGSRICEELVERVLPPMAAERRSQPRHAIVVLNDYHLLGKRIVLATMRASGFEILDYGRMEVDELVARIVKDKLEILLISVLMLPSALKVKDVRAALDSQGYKLRIAVGGAPFFFDPDLWREVGADAMGRNAADAVAIVSRWMKEMS